METFEDETFLQYMGLDTWPGELEKTKQNLLQSYSIGKQIFSNSGNTNNIIDSFYIAIVRLNLDLSKNGDELIRDSTSSVLFTAHKLLFPNTYMYIREWII